MAIVSDPLRTVVQIEHNHAVVVPTAEQSAANTSTLHSPSSSPPSMPPPPLPPLSELQESDNIVVISPMTTTDHPLHVNPNVQSNDEVIVANVIEAGVHEPSPPPVVPTTPDSQTYTTLTYSASNEDHHFQTNPPPIMTTLCTYGNSDGTADDGTGAGGIIVLHAERRRCLGRSCPHNNNGPEQSHNSDIPDNVEDHSAMNPATCCCWHLHQHRTRAQYESLCSERDLLQNIKRSLPFYTLGGLLILILQMAVGDYHSPPPGNVPGSGGGGIQTLRHGSTMHGAAIPGGGDAVEAAELTLITTTTFTPADESNSTDLSEFMNRNKTLTSAHYDALDWFNASKPGVWCGLVLLITSIIGHQAASAGMPPRSRVSWIRAFVLSVLMAVMSNVFLLANVMYVLHAANSAETNRVAVLWRKYHYQQHTSQPLEPPPMLLSPVASTGLNRGHLFIFYRNFSSGLLEEAVTAAAPTTHSVEHFEIGEENTYSADDQHAKARVSQFVDSGDGSPPNRRIIHTGILSFMAICSMLCLLVALVHLTVLLSRISNCCMVLPQKDDYHVVVRYAAHSPPDAWNDPNTINSHSAATISMGAVGDGNQRSPPPPPPTIIHASTSDLYRLTRTEPSVLNRLINSSEDNNNSSPSNADDADDNITISDVSPTAANHVAYHRNMQPPRRFNNYRHFHRNWGVCHAHMSASTDHFNTSERRRRMLMLNGEHGQIPLQLTPPPSYDTLITMTQNEQQLPSPSRCSRPVTANVAVAIPSASQPPTPSATVPPVVQTQTDITPSSRSDVDGTVEIVVGRSEARYSPVTSQAWQAARSSTTNTGSVDLDGNAFIHRLQSETHEQAVENADNPSNSISTGHNV